MIMTLVVLFLLPAIGFGLSASFLLLALDLGASGQMGAAASYLALSGAHLANTLVMVSKVAEVRCARS